MKCEACAKEIKNPNNIELETDLCMECIPKQHSEEIAQYQDFKDKIKKEKANLGDKKDEQ